MDKQNLIKFGYGLIFRNNRIKQEEIYKKENPSKDKITICEALEGIIKSSDLESFYAIEKLFLENERQNLTISKQKENSLAKALEQIIDARSSLDLIQNKVLYKKGLGFFTSKTKDNQGLPFDGVRLYIKSQSARLTNLAKAVETKEQSEIIQARKVCLKAFKNAYIVMQAKQLDIDLKPTSNEKMSNHQILNSKFKCTKNSNNFKK